MDKNDFAIRMGIKIWRVSRDKRETQKTSVKIRYAVKQSSRNRKKKERKYLFPQ